LTTQTTLVDYPGEHNTMNIVGGNTPNLTFSLALCVSKGLVNDCYPTRRDSRLAFYPCFSTSATMRPGQSGGPVLSVSQFGIIGVNSRSMDGFDDYSIVSWLGYNGLGYSQHGIRREYNYLWNDY